MSSDTHQEYIDKIEQAKNKTDYRILIISPSGTRKVMASEDALAESVTYLYDEEMETIAKMLTENKSAMEPEESDEWVKTYSNLRDSKKNKENFFRDYLQQLSTQNFSDYNYTYKRALKLYIEDKLPEALSVLEAFFLSQINNGRTVGSGEMADCCFLRGECHMARFEYEEAGQAFEKALDYHPSWYHASRTARFLDYFPEKHEQAFFYKKIAVLKATNDSQKVEAWDRIADYYVTISEFEKATNACHAAIKIARRLVAVDPLNNYAKLGTLLNRMGYLDQKAGAPEKSLKSYLECLEICRKLARTFPKNQVSLLTKGLYFLGVSYSENKKYQDAIRTLEECIAVIKKAPANIALKNPIVLFEVCFSLGKVHEDIGENKKAYKNYLAALRDARGKATNNPLAFNTEKIMIFDRLINLDKATDNLASVRSYLFNKITVYKEMVLEVPEAYLTPMGEALESLVSYYRKEQMNLKAEQVIYAAIEFYTNNQEASPTTYALQIRRALIQLGGIKEILYSANYQKLLPGIAMAYGKIINYYLEEHDLEEAEIVSLEALEVYELLVNKDPLGYLPGVTMILTNLAIFQKQKHDQHLEEYYLRKALPMFRILESSDTPKYTYEVANIFSELGHLQRGRMAFDQAILEYNKVVVISEKLANNNPEKYLIELTDALGNLAVTLRDKEEYTESEKNYLNCIDILNKATSGAPEKYLPNLALTLSNYAELLRLKEDLSNAQKYNIDALNIILVLAENGYPENLYKLGYILLNAAKITADQGLLERADNIYQEVLELFQYLVAVNPENYLTILGIAETQVAIFYQSDQPDEMRSLEYAQRALLSFTDHQQNLIVQWYLADLQGVFENWDLPE